MTKLCRADAADGDGNNGGLADERGSRLNRSTSEEASADPGDVASSPAPDIALNVEFCEGE